MFVRAIDVAKFVIRKNGDCKLTMFRIGDENFGDALFN